MKTMIRSRIVLLNIIILMYTAVGVAGERKGEKGFGATLTNKGFGLRLSYNRSKGPASLFTTDFEIINVKGKNELSGEIYNPFTGRYERFKIGDENLLLMPLMFGYRKNMWHDQIANNFQPYIQLSGGPVLAFDLKEEDPFATDIQENVGFIEQFSKGKAYYTIGASLSGGAVIETSKNRFINISVNYSIIDYGRDLDHRRALGGLAFRVEFGSWIR
ncbi:MAG: hypothetical protein IIB40_03665 [Candidatus Marinimicrobia bacterium]|nr:hypothetical protein [Candidatus Neomarinimicrobiota bacterium]